MVRYEGDWVEGKRQGKGQYVAKQSGAKYEVRQSEVMTSRCLMETLITREHITMIRRRARASTAGATGTGTRASGRRDSDTATASMYGRIKMKSTIRLMTFWSLSGDSPFTLLRYLSFVDSITAFFQIQKTAQ